MYVILSLVVYIFLSFSFLENELIDKVNWNSRSSIANIVNYTDEKWTKHSTRRRPKINDTGNSHKSNVFWAACSIYSFFIRFNKWLCVCMGLFISIHWAKRRCWGSSSSLTFFFVKYFSKWNWRELEQTITTLLTALKSLTTKRRLKFANHFFVKIFFFFRFVCHTVALAWSSSFVYSFIYYIRACCMHVRLYSNGQHVSGRTDGHTG